MAGAACYAPDPPSGAACADGVCPEGLTCSPATNTCEVRAIDAGADSSEPPLDVAIDAAAMPMIVQQATNHGDSVATLSATLPATPVAGHILIMIGANLSGSLVSVSGGAATWTKAASSLVNSNVEIWFGLSSGMGAVVTIARPQTPASMWISVSEWDGLATTNSLDAAHAAYGTANPVTAGSIATTNAHDLLVFAATTALPSTHGAPTPGSWTAMQGVSSATHTQSAWYRVVTTAGPQAPQVVQSGTAGWEAAIAAFRIATP